MRWPSMRHAMLHAACSDEPIGCCRRRYAAQVSRPVKRKLASHANAVRIQVEAQNRFARTKQHDVKVVSEDPRSWVGMWEGGPARTAPKQLSSTGSTLQPRAPGTCAQGFLRLYLIRHAVVTPFDWSETGSPHLLLCKNLRRARTVAGRTASLRWS